MEVMSMVYGHDGRCNPLLFMGFGSEQEGTGGDKRGQEGKGEGGEIWSEQSGVLREGRKKYCAGKRIFLHGAGASCTMGIGCKSSKKSKE